MAELATNTAYRIKLFGVQARDMNTRELTITLPNSETTARDVLKAVAAVDPMLHGSLAVDHRIASPEQRVSPEQELALIGMVSGG